MSDVPESFDAYGHEEAAARAAQKAMLPGIFLIIVGALNILACVYFIFNAMVVSRLSVEDFKKLPTISQAQAKNLEENEKKGGIGMTQVKEISVYVYGGVGGVGLLTSLLTILGGVQMCRARSRGLAIFGSVLAMIPCISPTSCCALGIGIGIWSLVVLSNAE